MATEPLQRVDKLFLLPSENCVLSWTYQKSFCPGSLKPESGLGKERKCQENLNINFGCFSKIATKDVCKGDSKKVKMAATMDPVSFSFFYKYLMSLKRDGASAVCNCRFCLDLLSSPPTVDVHCLKATFSWSGAVVLMNYLCLKL